MMSLAPKTLCTMVRSMTGGGLERTVVTLANGFAQRGHRSALLVGVADGRMVREIAPGVCLIPLPLSSHLRARVWAARADWGDLPLLLPLLFGASPRMLRHARGLVRYLRTEPVDALLSAGTQSNLVALWARRVAGVPVRLVVSEHNTLSAVVAHATHAFRRAYPALAGRHYPSADAIVAVSDGVAADLARMAGIPPERIVTIRSPVVSPDLLAKSREPVDHPWFATGGVPVVLGVGRLHRQKDFPTLIRAFASVRAATPARLVILGEGEQRGALEALCRSVGVADDTALPGYVDNPFAWMARAAVFVLSSAWEGNGNVLVEAMACGCPVISTACPSGPAEILADGAYGPLVPVGDARALADAILAVLRAPVGRARLRDRATLFDRDRAVERYLEVLLGAAR